VVVEEMELELVGIVGRRSVFIKGHGFNFKRGADEGGLDAIPDWEVTRSQF
jgi:hypothetical protein